MDALELIRKPIMNEMKHFRDQFDASLQHTNPLLGSALRLVSKRTGKMMRPMLTILSSRLFGEANDNVYYAASTFEFFHTASLLHDDVVDESNQRRGEASINSAYSNQVAVLVGDFILALALLNASKTGSPKLVETFSVAAQNLADGELEQLDNVNNKSFSEDIYYHIIKNKTAALFAACAESGARFGGASESDIEVMRNFGEIVGIIFQIRDDIFDYNEDSAIGKPTGNDMKEGKLTLPVIFALNSTQDESMKALALKVKEGEVTDGEIATLVEFTKANGGIEYAQQVMAELSDKAKSLLNVYPDSDVKQALYAYVDYVVGRSL